MRRWFFTILASFAFALGSSSDSVAQSPEEYVPHPEGQFAGLDGYEILAAADRATAEADKAISEGDWGSAFAALDWAERFRNMVYQGNDRSQFDLQHRKAEVASKSSWHFYSKREFEGALAGRLRLLGSDHPDTLASLAGLAQVLMEIGLTDRALNMIESALDRVGEDSIATRETKVRLLNSYGLSLLAENRAEEAIWAFEDALKTIDRGVPDAEVRRLASQSYLASAHLEVGDIDAAKALGVESIAFTLLNSPAASRVERARAHMAYGDLEMKTGHPSQAQFPYNMALDQVTDDSGEHPYGVDVKVALARAALHLPDWRDTALGNLREAKEQIAGEERVSLNRRDREIHRLMIDAIAAQVDRSADKAEANRVWRADAFAAAVSSLDDSVDAAIISAIGRTAPGERGDLVLSHELNLDKLRELETERSFALGEGADEIAEEKRVAIIHTRDEVRRLEGELRKVYPRYLDFLGNAPISITTPSRLLSEGEALVMIIPGEIETHVFFFTHEKTDWHRAKADSSKIEASVRRLLWDVGAPNNASDEEIESWLAELQGSGTYPFSFNEAHFLYEQLFAKLDLNGVENLFVVADGPLASLPLGILVEELPSGPWGEPNTLRNAAWLGDRFGISVLPSIKTLLFLREHGNASQSEKLNEFLGFGNPVLKGQANRRGISAKTRASRDSKSARKIRRAKASSRGTVASEKLKVEKLRALSRLPGTAEELTKIWQTVGQPAGALFLGENATETRVRSMPLRAEILAFATHGLLAGEISEIRQPGLVLTPPQEPLPNDNGYLSAAEIAALDLAAQWVILSACNTASSDGTVGSAGLSGLARAFFFAGAQSLLVSHWPVRDDVAAIITVRAVELARSIPSLSRAQALAMAAKEIRLNAARDRDDDTWAHPNAWAPFSFVGDGSVRAPK